MASGRKRKFKGTEPKGRTPHLPAEDPKKVALGQPHRLGSPSERRCVAIGRVLEDHGYLSTGLSKSALYDAYNRFERARSGARRYMNSKRPYANSGPAGSGETPDDILIEYRKLFGDVDRELRLAGRASHDAIYMFLDNDPEQWVPPFWAMNAAIHGLIAIAQYYGIDIKGKDKER